MRTPRSTSTAAFKQAETELLPTLLMDRARARFASATVGAIIYFSERRSVGPLSQTAKQHSPERYGRMADGLDKYSRGTLEAQLYEHARLAVEVRSPRAFGESL